MNPQRISIISGIFISNVLAVIVMALLKAFSSWIGDKGVMIFSIFFIIPFLMGLLNAWLWRSFTLKISSTIGWCLISTLLLAIFSSVFLGEGYLCLIIVLPVVLAVMCCGTFIGKAMFRKKNNRLNSTVFGVLLVILIADMSSNHDAYNMVSDTMIVNAPIEKVWPYVVEYEPIKIKETYWLFKAGMPSPVQSTVDGHAAGAGRKCIFSNGYVFEEKMTVYKPNEELTFDIVEQPRDPEIMGHIDIVRGQFILKDNGNGTTTVIGNSWYKLYVFPAWYFNLWSESVTRNVHLRVMEHIKILSEKDV